MKFLNLLKRQQKAPLLKLAAKLDSPLSSRERLSMKLVKPFLKNISRRLTHLLTSDVGQVVVFIVRLMVAPHDKDNLEPLGPQGTQRLVMAMTFIPLSPVVELGPLTMVDRDKGKPVHRVAQMLVTGKTKVYDTTFATGFGHRHRSCLGLKVARGFPATLGIAELGPDRRHQGSAFRRY